MDSVPAIDLATAAVAQVYTTRGQRPLRLHWFAPQQRRAPAVIFFHGGSWRKGSPEQFAMQCQVLAQHGVGTATVEYRLLGAGAESVWDCIADAQAALRWVRQHADELAIDPHRIAAAGGSAGGHLAMSTALVDTETIEPVSCVPNLLVLYNPVTDTAPPAHWAEAFAGRAAEASPLHLIRPGLPETLIMHGVDDTTTPLSGIKTFARAMHDAGNACVVAPYAGVGHGFFNKPPYLWATTGLLGDTLARIGWVEQW